MAGCTPPPTSFSCFNINCYRKFPTEKGLRQHMWANESCKRYMSSGLMYASSREIVDVDGSQRRSGHKTESMRLNPTMCTDAPSYRPYDEFDYDDFLAGSFDTDDDDVLLPAPGVVDMMDPAVVALYSVPAAVLIDDESFSSPSITAIMEQVKARDRASLTAMQHDTEHRCISEILKILEDAQCPDYMLQSLLEWAYNAKASGFDFNPRAVTRRANINWMYRAMRNSHQRLPQMISVGLEDHDDLQDVVCFDFAPSLLSLLQDDKLMLPENLVVNLDDPTSMYTPINNEFGEAHTGERYRELYRELITSKNQLLVPIILYLDGTAIDSKGHIEVCPVSFTTSLFSEKVRRDSKAWRLLGFVPDLNRGRSTAMNSHANSRKGMAPGRTTRNFHHVMDVILKGMAVGQAGNDPRLKKVPLNIGGRWIVVDVVCPLLFVINDGKQGDQLCGRFNGHHKSQRRHHRSCDCEFGDLDNPEVLCTFLTTDMVNDLCRNNASDELLKHHTLYRVDNAFNRIQMGRNPHGIFMGAVIDVMHTVQHGIIMYAMESFKSFLNPQKLQMLDRLAIRFNVTCRQSIRSSFPRTDFARGITNLTLVECSEQSGALFLFAALTMQGEAWQALKTSFDDLEAVLVTMECILCFEAWLEQPTYWEIGDTTGEAERTEVAIASMMRLIVRYLPRQKGGKQKGNGWKVSKLHEIKHIVRFIVAFGGPRGYNASRPEEHHKAHAKRPGRRSQKNAKTIDQQCARRIADTYIIDTMHELFQKGQDCGPPKGLNGSGEERTVEEGKGTRYQIQSFVDPNNDKQLLHKVSWSTRTRTPINLEENVALFILQHYRDSDLDINGEGCVHCCTEYHKFDANNDNETLIYLRCHPNYRGEGKPWYDWAIIETEDDDGISQGRFPSRILSCIPRDVEGGSVDETPTHNLVVQFCNAPSGRESFLFKEWTFNTDFYIVPATALVRLCQLLWRPLTLTTSRGPPPIDDESGSPSN